MSTKVIKIRVSKQRLMIFLKVILPKMLSGKRPDTYGIGRACLLKTAQKAMSDVLEDFTTKSQGGTGLDGVQWEPLSEYTLKQRSDAAKGRSGTAGTPKAEFDNAQKVMLQQTRKAIYRQEYERLRLGGLSAKEAKRQAAIIARFMARSAWSARHAAAGGRGMEGTPGPGPDDFPILDETGRLKTSISPGHITGSGLNLEYVAPRSPMSLEGDQTLEVEPGRIKVMSHVPYGDSHMRDGQGTDTGAFRPARPWKYGEEIPDEWRKKWAGYYREALDELLPHAILAWASDGAKIT